MLFTIPQYEDVTKDTVSLVPNTHSTRGEKPTIEESGLPV